MSPEQAKVIYRCMEEQGEYLNRAELQRGFNRYEALRKLNVRQFTKLNRRNFSGENFDSMVDALVAGNSAKQQESVPVLPELPPHRHVNCGIKLFSEIDLREYALAAIAAGGAK